MKIKNLNEFNNWVNEFKKDLSDKEVIILSGPMGAGKTQFVQSLLADSADDSVMSPTFAIHNTYNYKGQNIDHIDLYRLENDNDLESTGFWELFDQESSWIIVEWGDRLDVDVYPLNWNRHLVQIQPVDGDVNARNVSVKRL